ncbi:MAG: porin [Flavobacteriales bacterium]|nr:porin [Flavobacteriales bacterium]
MKRTLLIMMLGAYAPSILHAQDSTAARIPFEGMDLTWVNGQNRQRAFPLTLKDRETGETILTGVALLDTYYNYDFADPIDNTHTISSSIGRHNEFTLNQASFGLESNYKNIIGRLWVQYGQMGSIVQDVDASVYRGRNTSINNLKYVREAAAGYHFDKWHGINLEMGIFMSYIGLESYVLQENWSYQRSMVCDFTPFYFSGARVQAFPSKEFKTELWLLNGWQSYNSFSKSPGLGSSNYYRPNEDLQLVANFYIGRDTQNPDTIGDQSDRLRFHHDNSIVARVFKRRESRGLSQIAFSLNNHYGLQSNNAAGDTLKANENFMMGSSLATRFWFNKNKLALTLRGDYVTNQSVVNGVNTSPYLAFTPAATGSEPNNYDMAMANGDKLEIAQFTSTFDVMPSDHVTFRFEYGLRTASVPYFSGAGGTTSPSGWTNGPATTLPWKADLQRTENRFTVAVNVRL